MIHADPDYFQNLMGPFWSKDTYIWYNFRDDSISSCYVKLLTDKQTNKRSAKYNLWNSKWCLPCRETKRDNNVVNVHLTRFHEVIVNRRRSITKRLVHDDVIQPEVARLECITWPGGDTVVEEVGLTHSMTDKEAKDIWGEVQWENYEINPVITVEQIDA